MPAPRRAPGGARDVPAHAALGGGADADERAARGRSRRIARRAIEVLVAAVSWPRYVEGVSNLAHKITDVTDCRGARAARRDGRARLRASSAAARDDLDAARRRGVARRRRAPAGGVGDLPRQPGRGADPVPRRARRGDPQAGPRPRRHGPPGPLGRRPDETVAAAMVACQRYGQSGILVTEDGRLVGSVAPRGPRQGDRPRPLARAGEGDHVRARPGRGRGDEPGRAPAPARRLGRGPPRSAPRRAPRRRGDEERRAAGARRGGRGRRPSRPSRSPTSSAALERLAPVFDAVAAASDTVDGVYLVGGTVRDILLGEPSFDVDIAVEGDAIALARSIAASARRPRARPREVRHGRRALRRRAARRRRHRAHGVLRRPGGAADGRARVDPRRPPPPRLHDQRHGRLAQGRRLRPARRPVRRARATSSQGGSASSTTCPSSTTRPGSSAPIRYENRLRLPHGRAHGAARARVHRDGARRRPVLDAAAATSSRRCSPRARSSTRVLRLAELGAAAAIHPHLAADEEAVAPDPTRHGTSRREYGLDVPAWRLGIAALARQMPPDEVYGWLESLKMRRRDVEQIAARRHPRARGSSSGCEGRGRRRRRSSRSPSRMRPTRRSSRWRSRSCRRSVATSPTCAASASR